MGSPPSPPVFLPSTPSVDDSGVTVGVFGRPPLRRSAILDIRSWLKAGPEATTPELHIKLAEVGNDRGVRLLPVGGDGARGGRGGAAAGASATLFLSVLLPAAGSDAPPDPPMSPLAVLLPGMRAVTAAGPVEEPWEIASVSAVKEVSTTVTTSGPPPRRALPSACRPSGARRPSYCRLRGRERSLATQRRPRP